MTLKWKGDKKLNDRCEVERSEYGVQYEGESRASEELGAMELWQSHLRYRQEEEMATGRQRSTGVTCRIRIVRNQGGSVRLRRTYGKGGNKGK